MPNKFAVRLAAWFALASLFTLLTVAQQTPPPSNPDPSTQTQPAKTEPQQQTPPSSADSSAKTQPAQPQTPAQGQAAPPAQPSSDPPKDPITVTSGQTTSGQGKVAGTSNDRLFYTLPDFLTLPDKGKLPPLSTKDKFKVVALGTFDYVQYPWWGLLSAISQAEDSEPAYGQGWASYAKRYGTTAADSTVENFMVGAVFPSVLHQDPRFYYMGHGNFALRTSYAVSRIFVTRTDSGKMQFNYSEIFGAATAAVISTYTYHPKSTYLSTPTNPHLFVPSDRTLTNTISVWGTQVGLDTITLVVKEFWPDVRRRWSHKHRSDQGTVGNSGT